MMSHDVVASKPVSDELKELIEENKFDDNFYHDEFFGKLRILEKEPKRVKHDNGYEYELEYQTSIFKLGNNYLFTDISTSHTIQISIFKNILSNVIKHITINKDTGLKINKIEENLNDLQIAITESQDLLLDKISELKIESNNKYNLLFDNIPTEESIEELINNKMFSVQQLKNTQDNSLKSSDISKTSQHVGTVLTASQIILLREQFKTADDLVKLREANLI